MRKRIRFGFMLFCLCQAVVILSMTRRQHSHQSAEILCSFAHFLRALNTERRMRGLVSVWLFKRLQVLQPKPF